MSNPDANEPPNVHLDTTRLKKNLKRRTVRGVGVSLGSQGVVFVIQMVSTAILARLLSPADFGLIGMVQVFTGFVSLFTDAGLSMATVQQEKVEQDQVSALFWLNGAMGVLLGLLTAAASPLFALLYREPQLLGVTLAVACTFPFAGFTVQHRALLRRQMRFSTLAADRVASLLVSSGLAIGLAWAGFQHWALVAMAVTQSVVTMLLMMWSSGWRPDPPRRGAKIREMVKFGGFLSGSQFLGYVRRNLDRMIIGVMWGAESLGIYRVAHRLILMPIQQVNQPISNVMVPALSRVQDQPDEYRAMYKDAVFVVVSLSLPVISAMLVTAPDLILFVLGEKWMSSVVYYYALGPAAVASALNIAGGWVFVSSGRAREQFNANIWLTIGTAGSMVLVAYWGPKAIAIAFSAAFTLSRIPHFAYAFKGTPIRLRDVGVAILWPSIACAIAAAVALLVQAAAGNLPLWARLGTTCSVFGLVYLAVNGYRTVRVVRTNLKVR